MSPKKKEAKKRVSKKSSPKVKPKRDDFPKNVKETLAKRAGYLCSVPDCKRLTIGPNADPNKSTNTGVAAHIISASPDNGPRHDATVNSDDRKSIANGIWCCATHAMEIDSNESGHSVEMLRSWKEDHEKFISLRHQDRFVGKGVVTKVTINNLGRFKCSQTIRFSKKTLILGGNLTGKRLICDMVSAPFNYKCAIPWKDRTFKTGCASAQIETYSNTETTWNIHFDDRVLFKANDDPVPTLYSGIRVYQLHETFRPNGPNRSDFGDGDDSDEDVAWEKAWNSAFLDDLASHFDLTRDGLITALSIMERTPGKFFTDVRIEGENLSWRMNGTSDFWKYGQLSGAEAQLVILDVFLRLAEYSAKFSPTILILNQHSFPSLDDSNLPMILKKLGELDLQCQLIVPLYIWPTDNPFKNWAVWHLSADSDHGSVKINEGVPQKQTPNLANNVSEN